MQVRNHLAAVTFTIRFTTAQFREHAQKLTRKTYLIPPPSAVAGIFGAILGVPRSRLAEFCREKNIMTGAELLSLNGCFSHTVRLYKFDRDAAQLAKLLRNWYALETLPKRKRGDIIKCVTELKTLYRSEVLYRPEYKLAIASSDESILGKCIERIENLDFEYEVFGGNDYHFAEHVGPVREARLVDSDFGRGYCPRSKFKEVRASEFLITRSLEDSLARGKPTPLIVPAYIGAEVREWYVFVYGAEIVTTEPLKAVDDGQSRIFVYPAHKFLVGLCVQKSRGR